jgi:protein gp37
MGDKSKIEWTDATWNPVAGCSIVSPGCHHCYAMRAAHRLAAMGQAKYAGTTKIVDGRALWTGQINVDPAALRAPLRWAKPRRVFVNSMSDLFHTALCAPDIADIFAIMALTPQHTYQVLTKRARRMANLLTDPEFRRVVAHYQRKFFRDAATGPGDIDWPLPNVWLGVSCEDQQRADERIPHLLVAPAAVRFVSAEPLLGPIELARSAQRGMRSDPDEFSSALRDPRSALALDWVIVGGESGPGARPMHPDWARGIRDQCVAAGVPFFFKQWGEWAAAPTMDPHLRSSSLQYVHDGDSAARMICLGKKAAGRLLDGREWDEFPGSAELGARSAERGTGP